MLIAALPNKHIINISSLLNQQSSLCHIKDAKRFLDFFRFKGLSYSYDILIIKKVDVLFVKVTSETLKTFFEKKIHLSNSRMII